MSFLHCTPCCGYSTKKPNKFAKHKLCHSEKAESQCPFCTFSVPDKGLLKSHVGCWHGRNGEKTCGNKCTCQHCRKKPTAKNESLPEQKKPWCRCTPCCGYKTRDRSQFKKHRAFHRQKSKFACPFCSYSVPTRGSLTKHVNKLHGGRSDNGIDCPCNQCKKKSDARQVKKAKKLARKNALKEPSPADGDGKVIVNILR